MNAFRIKCYSFSHTDFLPVHSLLRFAGIFYLDLFFNNFILIDFMIEEAIIWQ